MEKIFDLELSESQVREMCAFLAEILLSENSVNYDKSSKCVVCHVYDFSLLRQVYNQLMSQR